ncbi:MAG: flagellar biosynthesis protein FliR [Candidatus Poriferisodalaceae bacterium]
MWWRSLLRRQSSRAANLLAPPIFSRRMPAPARVALALAMSLVIQRPIAGTVDLARMIDVVAVNLVVGLMLGFVTGLIF